MSFMSDARNRFSQKLREKDRRHFEDSERPQVKGRVAGRKPGEPSLKANLGNCTKVYDIPVVGSKTETKDKDMKSWEMPMISVKHRDERLMSPEERFELAEKEFRPFSSFDRDGNRKTDKWEDLDAINTNKVFTNQGSHTRHRYRPYDKA